MFKHEEIEMNFHLSKFIAQVVLSSYYSNVNSQSFTLRLGIHDISTVLVAIELFNCALSFSVLLHLDQIGNQQNAHLKFLTVVLHQSGRL